MEETLARLASPRTRGGRGKCACRLCEVGTGGALEVAPWAFGPATRMRGLASCRARTHTRTRAVPIPAEAAQRAGTEAQAALRAWLLGVVTRMKEDLGRDNDE